MSGKLFTRANLVRRFVALTICAVVLQTAPAQQAPPPPPQAPGQQGGQSGAGQTPRTGTLDEIARARQSLNNGGVAVSRLKPLTIDPITRRTVQLNAPITFKVVARDPSLAPGVSLVYYLENGAPYGANIDPQLGTFSWTPTTAGTYTFYVDAADNGEPQRTVHTPVTIEVTPEIRPFGYDFFRSARALIDYRLAAVRSGFPSNAAQQSATNLPVITQLNQSGSVQSPLDQFRSTNILNGQPASLGQASSARQQGSNPTGAQNSNPPDQGNDSQNGQIPNANRRNQPENTAGQGGGSTGTGIQNPTSGNGQTLLNGNPAAPNTGLSGWASPSYQPPAPQPAPNADALRYFVGPFDMLGLNVFVPAPDRYQLGPGDLLTLRIWSPTLEATETDLRVDDRGQVALPMSGRRIVLRGQTLAQAEALLRHELRVDIRNAQISLALKALRTMSITVMGDAYLPGNYQVPAVATLFNALYMFGGPNDNGSLRHIELRRNDGTRRAFDLYRFLISGDAKEDVPLQPGDAIWISPAGPRITIKGEVARPAIYEATRSDHLREMIAFAGGPKATGVVQRVSLETVEPGVSHQLRDVDLRGLGTPESNPPIFDGDIATVFSVREQYSNAITVDGAVDQPGQYAATPGTTVADVIARARGLLPEAYLTRADLFRQNPDRSEALVPIDLTRALARDPEANPQLRPFDRLVVYSISDVRWMGTRQVAVRGAVQRPGTFYRPDNMRLLDLLLQAGGLSPDASMKEAFVQRTNPDGTAGPLIRVDLGRSLAGDPASNVVMADQDVVTVQSVSEAAFAPNSQVSIMGAVQGPGVYQRSSNMHLSDLLQLAGGTLPNSSDTVEITNARVTYNTPRTRLRISDVVAGTSDIALHDGDLVTIASRSDMVLTPKRVIILGAVKQPGPYAVNENSDRLSGLIARAGGFGVNAYPKGTQFFRDPALLSTVSQERLSPAIRKALDIVTRQQYTRELAKSAVDKAKFIQQASSGSPSLTLPGGIGSQTSGPVNVPTSLLDVNTVTPARTLTDQDLQPGGNININLPRALQHKGSSDDIVLRDGDIVVVPNTPTTVSVVGAVVVPSSVLFTPGESIKYYINHAGGFHADAAKDGVLLIRFNGSVEKPTSGTRVEVGDIVWVPTKVVAEKISSNPSIIDQITKTVFSAALVYSLFRLVF